MKHKKLKTKRPKKLKKKKFNSPFWPVVLRTVPPTIMTEEEAYTKVPYMRIFRVYATHPRDEQGAQSGPQE